MPNRSHMAVSTWKAFPGQANDRSRDNLILKNGKREHILPHATLALQPHQPGHPLASPRLHRSACTVAKSWCQDIQGPALRHPIFRERRRSGETRCSPPEVLSLQYGRVVVVSVRLPGFLFRGLGPCAVFPRSAEPPSRRVVRVLPPGRTWRSAPAALRTARARGKACSLRSAQPGSCHRAAAAAARAGFERCV